MCERKMSLCSSLVLSSSTNDIYDELTSKVLANSGEIRSNLESGINSVADNIDNVNGPSVITNFLHLINNQLDSLSSSELITGLSFTLFITLLTLSNITPGLNSNKSVFLMEDGEPYPSGSYNPTDAQRYFDSRPFVVAQRSVEIASTGLFFGLGIAIDYLTGKLTDEKQEKKRATEATNLLTSLGPTFIKVGQSLSIRTDLLRPAYANALATLQDQVPAFETSIARNIIESELGASPDTIFKNGLDTV